MPHLILHPIQLKKLAEEWLLEDLSGFDIGGGVVGSDLTALDVLYKSQGCIAGLPFADAICSKLGIKAKWNYDEGQTIMNPPIVIGTITGPANSVLLAERVVLNILSRASGIATVAFDLSQKLRKIGWHGVLAGTRKTTPGFRLVEKYALMIGGADPHRYDLSSMVMLKDNHISICGSITEAIVKAKRLSSFSQKIEVECQSLHEALEAGNAGCDVVMLDNFNSSELNSAAPDIKDSYPNILIEASGGISSSNIEEYANPHIDIISSSSLVQGYKAVDISMSVSKQEP